MLAIVLIILFDVYALGVLAMIIGFSRLEESSAKKQVRLHSITIIVPFRDDATGIQQLLQDFRQIQYDGEWNALLVDDHSSDLTSGYPNIPDDLRNVSFLKLTTNHGKKAAITYGINNTSAELIVTTDADCRVPSLWLQKINLAFQQESTRMTVGGVRINSGDSFFGSLQAMEFLSVAATSAATIGLGSPTMSNGANLSYRRSSFVECNGFEGSSGVTSGDDEFLMNKFARKWKRGVAFLFASDSIVETSPQRTVKELLIQRLRWAGKWKSNQSLTTRLIALFVWGFHIGVITTFGLAFAGLISQRLFISLFAVKFCTELVFLLQASVFFKVRWRWFSFLVLQFVYSFYVVTVGFMSQIIKVEWKGRVVETKGLGRI